MIDETAHINSAIPVTGSEGFVATTDTPQRARFEPLKLDDLIEVPTTPEEWTKAAGPIAFVMGTSKAVVQMTEEKVVEFTHGIGEERGSMLMHSFVSFIDTFRQSLALVENAEARILLAGGGDDGWPPAAAVEADPVFALLARESQLFRKANAALRRDEEKNGEGEAEHHRYLKFEAAMMATAPMTVAGFAALVERWIKRHGCVSRNDGLPHKLIMSLIKASKATAQPAAAQPDPVDILFAEWCDLQEIVRDAPSIAGESEDMASPYSRRLARLNEIEAEIIAMPTSLMRAAAIAVFELPAGTDHDKTPHTLPRDGDSGWLALQTLALVRPHMTGRVAEIATDLLDHPDRPFGNSKIYRLMLASGVERAEPMLQAAE